MIFLSSQSNSEDFSSDDERLGSSSLGVKKAGPTLGKASDLRPWRFTSLSLASLWEVINFVDYSLNQGAPVGHESAETPIGHESAMNIIGKMSLKASNDHEFILVVIDYFIKWVEATSYAKLTTTRVFSFISSHIICPYGVPHELISNKGVHFRVEAYHTSFCTSMRVAPYSLVYDLEVVLPVEIEMGSFRVALEQQTSEVEYTQACFNQLSLLDEKILRLVDHVHAY
ncbi:hypothetical protein CK203_060520 [Vitis vinifera]|uniref:Integrase catalytic domain-containing protein n=1 Tax=Vitis vinifera TaxID=29760 RepID=A0A438GTC4_VITVI|nr:hypothetical protein CK203_060520 [Vitis vinifera]